MPRSSYRGHRKPKTDAYSLMSREQLDKLLREHVRTHCGDSIHAQIAYIRSVALNDEDIRNIFRRLEGEKAPKSSRT